MLNKCYQNEDEKNNSNIFILSKYNQKFFFFLNIKLKPYKLKPKKKINLY